MGQDRNTISREEVDRIVKGGNYGWVVKSGDQINNRPTGSPTNTQPPPTNVVLQDPVAQYPTTETGTGGLAVIGGYVYNGSALPQYVGKFIFGDLNRQSTVAGGRMLYTDVVDASLQVFDVPITGAVTKPTAFLHGVGQDAAGEIYYLWGDGKVTKLVPVPEPASLALVAAGLAALVARGAAAPEIQGFSSRSVNSASSGSLLVGAAPALARCHALGRRFALAARRSCICCWRSALRIACSSWRWTIDSTRREFCTYSLGSSITNGVDHVRPSFRLHTSKKYVRKSRAV